jgi:hypothetical protein
MSAPFRFLRRPLRGLVVLAAAAALVACGSDDDDASAGGSSTTLSGVAATGLPIVGGNVNVSCAGGSALNATTQSDGGWTVTTSGQTLPCAVQVSGGTLGVGGTTNASVLHSIALDFGTVNVTPLTDLVLANQLGTSPQTWFAAPAFAGISAASVQSALANVATALGISGTLGGRNPLTTTFAATSGDAIDDTLEALGAALQTLGQSYASLLAAAGTGNFTAFAGLPSAITTALNGNGGGGGGGTCTTGVAATFGKAGGQAAGPYTEGQQVCITASATSLTIDSLTLSNPTPNTALTGEYSGYVFAGTGVGAGLNYELVLKNGALYEVNVGKPNAISAADFHGQLKPSAGGGAGSGVTMTLEVSISGVVASSIAVPNQTAPAGQAEFCADIANDPNLTGVQVQGGVTLTITGCSFASNVGTVSATAQVSGISVPYVVRFIYGS